MSTRFWAIATIVTGVATLSLFVVFSLLPEVQAAGECLGRGAVVQFELARNISDLIAIFGEPDSACRPLAVSAMDAVNHLDMAVFIPVYTLFCICGGALPRRWRLAPAARNRRDWRSARRRRR